MIVNVVRLFAVGDLAEGFTNARFVAFTRDAFVVVREQKVEEDVPQLGRPPKFVSVCFGQIV